MISNVDLVSPDDAEYRSRSLPRRNSLACSDAPSIKTSSHQRAQTAREANRAPECRIRLSCGEEPKVEVCRASIPSEELSAASRESSASGQRGREFHDAMIEERRPHFQRMRHAHAIRLVQNIVGKKVSLIEPQIGREIIVPRPKLIAQFAEDTVQSGRQLRTQASRRFCASEKVPFQKTCARSGSAASPREIASAWYSKLIFSSETGHASSAPSASRAEPVAAIAGPARQPIRSIRQIAAEQFVRAFATKATVVLSG